MGIASRDLTGDGYPEVFLTSQGDNKLQTLENGPAQPTYKDMALKAGVTAQRPYAGGDVLPSTAWHPEFEDVNNDGLVDLFVSKGNVEAQPDYATLDPSNLLIGQADGTFVEGAEAAGIVGYERARAAHRSSTSTSTGCSTSSSSTARRTPPCGETSAAATPNGPARWATGSKSDSRSLHPTSTLSARGSRSRWVIARLFAR